MDARSAFTFATESLFRWYQLVVDAVGGDLAFREPDLSQDGPDASVQSVFCRVKTVQYCSECPNARSLQQFASFSWPDSIIWHNRRSRMEKEPSYDQLGELTSRIRAIIQVQLFFLSGP